jgi:U3 small nucleolar RNA-associated protein 11
MAARMDRDAKLTKLDQEVQLRRALASKGSKRKVGTDSMGLPVYRWRAERKR